MPEDSAAEVVTFGEPMTLLLATGDVPLGQARQFDASIAGAESNLAIGLARLGHRVAFFGRVGADVFGQRIRRELRAEGVGVSALRTDPDRPTGLLLRDSAQGAPITVVYGRAGSAATAMSVAELPVDVIEKARILHATGITAALSDSAYQATLEAMRIARRSGVLVTFDPNVRLRLAPVTRWQQIVDTLARQADVVLTGADETAVLGLDAEPASWFADRGASTVVVKLGALGATEYDLTGSSGYSFWHQPARFVTAVDPVGAGDAFNAGWLSAWLRGVPPDQRLLEAAAVASLVVATRGDSAGLPDADTRQRVLDQGADIDR
jgi:2-dehydro-3-deoxygluconokinase